MYSCPRCHSPASQLTGCPTCGGGPDPAAAEVFRLDTEIASLKRQLEQAWRAVQDIPPLIDATKIRRNAAAARMYAAKPVSRTTSPGTPETINAVPEPGHGPATPEPAHGPATPEPAPAPLPVRAPETSTKFVQNLLFLLGGLLLAIAAIVFTVVAWAQFGIGGRSVLLAFFTAATLAVPPLALRRGLSATAETFAAVGLLLVLLDGYASWYVNLFHVADHSPWCYVALICALTATLAAGYRRLTGLTGPRFVALALAQPVLPLFAVPANPGLTGWAFIFATVAALDVAVLARRRVGFRFADLGIAAYLMGALSLAVAGCCAITALVQAKTVATGASASAALLVTVLIVLAAAALARNVFAQSVAGALIVVAVDGVGFRFALLVGADLVLLRLAVVTLIVALLVAAAKRVVPPAVIRGPWIGVCLTLFAPVLMVFGLTAQAAIASITASGPLLGAAWGTTVAYAGWSLPVSILVLAAALVITVVLSWRSAILLGWLLLSALTLPAGLHLRWWTAPIFDLVGVAIALTVLLRVVAPPVAHSGFTRSPSAQSPAVQPLPPAVASDGSAFVTVQADEERAVSAAPAATYAPPAGDSVAVGTSILAVLILAIHAILVGFGQSGTAAAVLGTVAGLGFTAATLARNWSRYRELGSTGVLIGLIVVPAIAWTTCSALGLSTVLQSRTTLGSIALAVAALILISRRAPHYRLWALAAVLPCVLTAPLWALASADSPAVYAAIALLFLAFAVSTITTPTERAGAQNSVSAVRAELGWIAATAAPLALTVLVTTGLSLVQLFVVPYLWLAMIWSGSPRGVPYVAVIHAVVLVLKALTAVVVSYFLADNYPFVRAAAEQHRSIQAQRLHTAGRIGVPALALAVPPTLAAANVPWLVLPFVELALGLTGFLFAARHRLPWSISVVAAVLSGAGLAGALPTQATTLTALAAVLLATAVVGNFGRTTTIRLIGWSTASASAIAVAVTAGNFAQLDLHGVAFVVLATSALVFGLSWRLTAVGRAHEARAVETVAHAGAILALILTVGSARQSAVICILWGVALGMRALGFRPGQTILQHTYVVAAAIAELVGWCLLMGAAHVSTVEVYTVPTAAVALFIGLLARHRQPSLSSWTGYGPALAAALLPSLASILGANGQYLRRLLLGLAALAIVLLGAKLRLKAPILVGGGVLALVAVHELAQVWDLIPRWIPLAVGGLILVSLAVTLERRRADLARLRAALDQMN